MATRIAVPPAPTLGDLQLPGKPKRLRPLIVREIKEHCFIRNTLNGNETYVGNVCINRFIGIDTGNLFEGLRRIAAKDSANANEDLIIHAYRLGYIFEGEYKFLMDTRRKRKLSPKQLAWKQKINRRIINQTVVRRRRGA